MTSIKTFLFCKLEIQYNIYVQQHNFNKKYYHTPMLNLFNSKVRMSISISTLIDDFQTFYGCVTSQFGVITYHAYKMSCAIIHIF